MFLFPHLMLNPAPHLVSLSETPTKRLVTPTPSVASGRDDASAASTLTSRRNDFRHPIVPAFASDNVTTPASSADLSTAQAPSVDGVARADEGDAAVQHPKTMQEPAQSRGRRHMSPTHAEANANATYVSPTRYGTKHTEGPALARDSDVLRRIVDCKYLSAAQLQRLHVASSVTSIRRILRRLEGDGWIRMWEAWIPVGGRTKYALPQRKALQWALDRKREEAIGTPLEYLSWTLIGRRSRKPVAFRSRTIPPFLAHQVQTNDVMLALQQVEAPKVLWATSWDRPFPLQLGTFVPPQPDAVLSLDHGRELVMLFVEMDRATQKVPDFVHGKSRYARFARQPALMNETFGTTQFHTLVVVHAKSPQATRARVELLERAARANRFGGVLTFVAFDAVLRDAVGTVQLSLAAMESRRETDSGLGQPRLPRKDSAAA